MATTISLALIFILSIHMLDATHAAAAGLTVDLIHRDSLQPASLHTTSTSLQRSFHRLKNLARSPSADIVPNSGEYLMKISLGTPGVETLAIADTGSDLTWIQCKPCIKCFQQTSPIFDPSRSSTYKKLPCASTRCQSIPRTSCVNPKRTCGYTMTYGDNSVSKGDVATDKITLGGTASFPDVTIGCGHFDQGTFGAGTSGIVGLGGGNVSLISQMGGSVGGRFSYCLVPLFRDPSSQKSKMHFGENALVAGDGVVSTPIVAKKPATYYWLTLEGVTVGSRRLNLVSSRYKKKAAGEGNIIIDSGTTLTFLPADLYNQIERAVRSQVRLRPVNDPQGLLKLCYQSNGGEVKVPEITVHFKGADVKLGSVNTFVRTSETSLCLAFAPASSIAIYGNLAQMNFLVGYDLEKRSVSFKPTDCGNA